jgi:DNA polymerase III delta subunit
MSSLIGESLEKLFLLSETTRITQAMIDESIHMEWGGKIFDLIDAILAQNVKKSLSIFHALSSETTMYSFLPGFITLLRWSVYIRYLKEYGESEGGAWKIMKLYPFVTKKAYNSRISWKSLSDFYDKIVFINIAYRSGKWLHDPELWRIFWIERAIMSLKK